MERLSSLQEMLSRGIEVLPEASHHSYTKLEHTHELYLEEDKTRRNFYQLLKNELPADLWVYYPGSGADPIPAAVYGPKAVYTSNVKRDNFYYRALKSEEEPPNRYKRSIEEFGPFKDLNVLYSDVRTSPFRDASFDLIILNGLRGNINTTEFVNEISRILKPGGILVVEGDISIDIQGRLDEQYSKLLQNFYNLGFSLHELDRYGGAMNVTYTIYYEEDLGIGLLVNKSKLLDSLGGNNRAFISAHEIRVFQHT